MRLNLEMIDRFKCANAARVFGDMTILHFNSCRFRALAYTTLDRLGLCLQFFFLYSLG